MQERWYKLTPLQLSSYGLWRLVWIHPFVDGNGRTARAVAYFLLCARGGHLLDDKPILPDRIRGSRNEYYKALQVVHDAYAAGRYGLEAIHDYLSKLTTDAQ